MAKSLLPATEDEVNRARIEMLRALGALFNTLRDVALDLRAMLQREAEKRG
jgi:hypothetical protein